ncbi:biotin synthase BioB [candidate division WOR-1 bacterium RIFOXYD2_FULL_36_8]|uniref:Biotin synthase n=1 Tax=candidate division WOR-1 bacterium RIFOXYB2_FULL_36_35 TaxID=1802578 RepID=A0A1F4S2W0_UNCSA|nr:MAG: biotin synthase BioB [candidate division WOR-1 bacterium RIFOXYA2_FULL_36_21]OGC14750.1 MAG: biotin synthase BioB [candidate division WOR-1 bacterium RIFOXYB2_FULL_36_35]OGC15466.1 MAG: biotin synthase BioB [candidate division WOR-1 bacterium RIFOXYA12_FULL_36_13]OGC38030.1 MAG: biotin synthase BioB [candidate division WOR-1 bacterium RIFOXYD2_FULL_36_8]
MNYKALAKQAIKGKKLSFDEAMQLLKTSDDDTFEFLSAANHIKRAFKGNKVKLCAIVNAKSGKCTENCSFCAQSAHHKANSDIYPLMSDKKIFSAAKKSEEEMMATCFSIVTSGKSIIKKDELATIGTAIKNISKKTSLNRCVSMGTLSKKQIEELKAKGLKRLHHNLETAESFFGNICTTHSYKERLDTIKEAKKAGLEICSGGIFGLGESLEQRLELAFTLRELEVESVPINILNPIKGTPAAKNYKPIKPFEVLRLIATYRFLLPKADIGVFGGREKALRSLQPLMFIAGANVTLIGNYLTTKGRSPEKDLQMINELGLKIDQDN